MSRRSRTIALILSFLVLLIAVIQALVGFNDADHLRAVALYAHCPVLNRFTYTFFHASFIHALLNVWCMTSIVFFYNIHTRHLLLAYAIALSYPATLFGCSLTVGLSSVCFALMGMAASRVARPYVIHTFVAASIALMMVTPHVLSLVGLEVGHAANLLHAYCYLVAFIITKL